MGNLPTFRTVKEESRNKFYQDIQKKRNGVFLIDENMYIFQANKNCSPFFDCKPNSKLHISSLPQKFQPHTNLTNHETALKIIKEIINDGSTSKKMKSWLFKKNDEEVWSFVYPIPTKIGNDWVCRVFIKPDESKQKTLTETTKLFNASSESDSSLSTFSNGRMERSPFSPRKNRKNSINESDNINLMLNERHKKKITFYNEKIQRQKVENQKLLRLFNAIVPERNKLLEKVFNLTNVYQSIEELKEIYDKELTLVEIDAPFLKDELINVKQEQNLRFRQYLRIKKYQEDYYELESEVLENKYRILVDQIKRAKRILSTEILLTTNKNLNKFSLMLKQKMKNESVENNNINSPNRSKSKKPITSNMVKSESYGTYDYRTESESESQSQSQSQMIESDSYLSSISSSSGSDSNSNSEKEEVDKKKPNSNVNDNQNNIQLIPLNLILSKEEYYSHFLKYLVQYSCQENLLFYFEVENYRKITKKKRKLRAHKILRTYIMNGSPSQVNISSIISQDIVKRVKQNDFSQDLFNKAQNSIYSLMQNDSYSNFVISDEYKELKKKFISNESESDYSDFETTDNIKKDRIINNMKLNKIAETLKSNKKSQKHSLKLKWDLLKDIQFILNFEHANGFHRIQADTPKIFGGHETAPSPIEMIAYSLGAGFTQTLVYICSTRGIKLDEVLVETIIQSNVKQILYLETKDPLIPLIQISLAIKSKVEKKYILEAVELAKQNCPMVRYITKTNRTSTKIIYKKHNSKRITYTEKKFNNINLKTFKKRKEKIIQENREQEFLQSTIHGKWNTKRTKKKGLYRAIIKYGKNKHDIWESDLPTHWGGNYSGPCIFDFFLSGIGSCYMSQMALAAAINGIKICQCHLKASIDINWNKIWSKKLNTDKGPILDNLNFEYHIAANCSEERFQEISKIGMNNCLGVYLSQNEVPLEFKIYINEDLSEMEQYKNYQDNCYLM
ncbi:hydroperoxide reductase [Anaeramoeba flamelloides]|uniref:Hydroperoxide reductase n=1 Tax=Anaeramoeba flamelloides TaxID=1746091 RepID=A0AAV7ZTQ3_9EUKA|nr:hydroperoxide reductase [Anaeramoeba flamelloides]